MGTTPEVRNPGRPGELEPETRNQNVTTGSPGSPSAWKLWKEALDKSWMFASPSWFEESLNCVENHC